MMFDDDRIVLEALSLAIRMEIDGMDFYIKASEASRNETGRKLLRTLASEEESHLRKCREIYDATYRKKPWPEVERELGETPAVKTIFAQASRRPETTDSELESIKLAMDMENKTYDFYTRRGSIAAGRDERRFYQALAAEENKHKLALLDYYDYLTDPAAWFVKKEHPSLD